MRPIWTGGISFGLIYIPVNMYSATENIQIDLDMLSKKELNPIRYARIDTETGKEVAWKDVVKGFKYKDGNYVVLEPEDFEKANIEMAKSIDISYFVSEDEIDPVLYEKPYYLEPDKKAGKTYKLLLDSLRKSKKVGVAEFVVRNREHLAIVKAEKDLLVLLQLRYPNEIKKYDDLLLPKNEKYSDKEEELAKDLIEKMTERFEPRDFKDDYVNELKRIIEAKAKHKKITTKGKVPTATKVDDLMEELKRSLKHIEAS